MSDLRWVGLLLMGAVIVNYAYARVQEAGAEPAPRVEQISGGAGGSAGSSGFGGGSGAGAAGSAGSSGAAGSGVAGVGIR